MFICGKGLHDMALEKKIVANNGVTGNYHRIHSMIIEDGIITVEVRSYTEDSYREKEKTANANFKRQFTIGETVTKMCETPPEKRSKEYEAEIQALMKEGEQIKVVQEDMNCSIGTQFIKLDFSETNGDISFGDIYKKLKEIDTFANSKDI